MEESKSIKIKANTLKTLKDMAHPGQSVDGVIRELIDFKKERR